LAIQSPFFHKRDNDTAVGRTPSSPGAAPYPNASAQQAYAAPQTASASNPAGHLTPAALVPPANSAPVKESASKLTVGPNIKLKGVEITDCDTLVVEGTVEATMDSRLMHISEQGAFKGSAEIDIAEIHGAFDGTLTVRKKLVIYATGRVTGKVRYGKVVIEEGGQLSGEIQFGLAAPAKPQAMKPDLQVIA
jgi:cytoskeletal protein CcmA (bactofilin family)